MTLTNHLLAGSLIAKLAPLPVAIPLAFASHFILDSLPHFGFANLTDQEARKQHPRLIEIVMIADVLSALLLSLWLVHIGHVHWLVVGLIAYSPDLWWIYRFIFVEKMGKVAPPVGNRFLRFHANLQLERQWGGLLEMMYALSLFFILR